MRVAAWAVLLLIALIAGCTTFSSEPSPAVEAGAPPDDRAIPDATVPSPDAAPEDAAVLDAPVDAGRPPCAGEAPCARLVFVTSEFFAGEDIGSAIGGDGRCAARAALSKNPAIAKRQWQAWMSDDGANFTAAARLTHGTMPYRLPSGVLLANDWAQLTSGALAHAIDEDEDARHVGADFVWTGTTTSAQRATATCTGWTINGTANTGTVGRTNAADSTWTNSGTVGCGEGHRLYCIEK
jgi:hypothetical protein